MSAGEHMSAASLREARKCLYAAAVMADDFGKPKTADKFRAAEVALDDLRLADVGGLEDSGGFTLTADRQASEAAHPDPHGSCLICGYDKPWVVWHTKDGEPTTGACADCKRGADRESRQ